MGATTNVPCKFLAQLFGVTQRRVQQLAADGVIEKGERGEYPMLACVKGYVSFLQEAANRVGGDNEEILKSRARYERARADQIEMDVAVRKAELLFAADVEDEMTAMVANFRARVLATPSAVAAQGAGMRSRAKPEALIRDKIYEALDELSRYDPESTEPTANRKKRRRRP